MLLLKANLRYLPSTELFSSYKLARAWWSQTGQGECMRETIWQPSFIKSSCSPSIMLHYRSSFSALHPKDA